MRTLAVAGALAAATSSLAAQTRPRVALEANGAVVQLKEKVGASRVALGGVVLAGEARIARGRFLLGAGYLDGRLEADSASLPSRNLVEGRAFVGAEPWPWLTVTAGPLLRAYVTDSATERWVLWQARARLQGPLLGTKLATYVELWRALSAQVNLPDAVDRVQGGEAGIVFRPSQRPLWMRLAYRIDDAALGGARHQKTVEAISFAVGVGGR